MAHLRGVDHRAMRGNPRYSWVEGWAEHYAWAVEGFPIDPTPAPGRPTLIDRRQARLEHARTMLARWEATIRRAQGRVRAWRRRLRVAERALAATPRPPAEVDR